LADWNGGGLTRCGYYSPATITNCIVWDNSATTGPQMDDTSSTPSYCCIQDWSGGGVGNISADPRFVNPAFGDFRLMRDSPCIDAGGFVEGLTVDFEGDPRPFDFPGVVGGDGSNFDIGADECLFDKILPPSSWTLY